MIFLIRSNEDAGVKSRDEMDTVQVAVLMLYSEGKKREGKESQDEKWSGDVVNKFSIFNQKLEVRFEFYTKRH